MNIIVGFVITIGCVLGGFMAMGGHIEVLNQPFELLIIGGAAIGGFIMTNPVKTIKDTIKALGEAFKNKVPKEREYLDTLSILYSLMRDLRTKSRNEIESHIDNPEESELFQSAPTILKNKELTAFICDYVRLIIIGNARPHEIEALMDERKKLERELTEARKKLALGGGGAAGGDESRDIGGVRYLGKVVTGVAPKDLKGLVDAAKASLGSGVAAFVAVSDDGKASVVVGVTEDLTSRLSAVDLVRAASEAIGGKGGGGRPDMAQAGGPDGVNANAAIDAVAAAIG